MDFIILIAKTLEDEILTAAFLVPGGLLFIYIALRIRSGKSKVHRFLNPMVLWASLLIWGIFVFISGVGYLFKIVWILINK